MDTTTRKVRAFVGHSFSDSDQELVGKVLRYLSVLEEVNPQFSWEHAEAPEPSCIDEKVLRLFQDKNLFIGICTKKEAVAVADAVKPMWFSSSKMCVETGALSFKTSDWVIQEIGFAIGRGMNVVLLLEEGVRPPGGLQGTLEYISFSRQSPERSFDKLLQMISKLSASHTTRDDKGATSPPQDATEGDVKVGDRLWTTPTTTWSRDRYEISYMHLTAVGDFDGADSIEEAYLASATSTASSKESWAAYTAFVKLLFKPHSTIDELKKLAGEAPGDVGVIKYLARGLREREELAQAAHQFRVASELAQSSAEKLDLLQEAIDSALKVDKALADEFLVEMRRVVGTEPSLAARLLISESAFARASKAKGFHFATMECYLAEYVDEHSKRFDLAYEYSEKGQTELSAYHYLRIPEISRAEGAWNNLGVEFEKLKLPIRSIDSYRKSIALGSTLAASNLANQMLNSGFIDEAIKTCEDAARKEDHHNNVDTSLARARGSKEAESKLLVQILEKAKNVSDFYRGLGGAMIKQPVPIFEGKWVFQGAALEVKFNGSAFVATGKREGNVSALRRLNLGVSSSETYDVAIVGVVRGRAIEAVYESKPTSEVKTILGGLESKKDLLMYFLEDGETIMAMIGPDEIVADTKILKEVSCVQDEQFDKAQNSGRKN